MSAVFLKTVTNEDIIKYATDKGLYVDIDTFLRRHVRSKGNVGVALGDNTIEHGKTFLIASNGSEPARKVEKKTG